MTSRSFVELLKEERQKILQKSGIFEVIEHLDYLIKMYSSSDIIVKKTLPQIVSDFKFGEVNVNDSIKLKEKSSNKLKSNKNEEYKAEWQFRKKIAFVLNDAKRFLHIKEIIKEISERDNVSPVSITGAIKSRLNSLSKAGLVVVYQPGGHRKYSYWGLQKWLDPIGRPLPEFVYKELEDPETNIEFG